MVSHVWLFFTPWTAVHQTLLSMGFPRQEYLSELPFPPLGNLPEPGIKPASPALAGRFFTTGTTSEALLSYPMVTNIKLPNLSIFQQGKFISQSPFMSFIGWMQFYSLSPSFWEQSTRNRQFLRPINLRAGGKWNRKPTCHLKALRVSAQKVAHDTSDQSSLAKMSYMPESDVHE